MSEISFKDKMLFCKYVFLLQNYYTFYVNKIMKKKQLIRRAQKGWELFQYRLKSC